MTALAEVVSTSEEPQFIQSVDINKLMPALIDAKAEFDPVLKDATNPHFHSRFSSLSSVYKAVDTALLQRRIMHTCQPSVAADGTQQILTRIIHESGQWIGGIWALNPVKNDPQGVGSALSYARRYTLCALLGIAPEDDDDGNAASGPRKTERVKASKPASEPTGRNWAAEIDEIFSMDAHLVERRRLLLLRMDECRGFGELDAALNAKFVKVGTALKSLIEKAA